MIRKTSIVRVVLLASFGAALLVPAGASAAITDVFGGTVACTTEGDGVRFCGSTSPRSTVEAHDGVPIDVNAAFPPAPGAGPDGNYPIVMLFHGYGGSKSGLGSMQHWLDQGYATFSMTARGFHESCGTAAAKAADPSGCADGFVRLIDNRYEVRDAQEFAGTLVDEGLVDPGAIGATGGSYGGGVSLALASLQNRKALPDGSLVPWESPLGTPMEIAAAAPFVTWSDLAYSLVPNGGTLDYVADARYEGRFGVMKESLVNGLYFSGQLAPGFYAPEGTEPSADLTGWRNRLLAGEPYDGDPTATAIRDEITTNHSSYYIDDSVAPAPLLMANGTTDDLFPVDEMLRYYNRTRTNHPDAKLAMIVGDVAGHPRSQFKADVTNAFRDQLDKWFAHFLKGEGAEPAQRIEAYTQTCPADADSGGPFHAENWARLAPGEIRFAQEASATIAPDGGSATVDTAFNPVGGGGACVEVDGADLPGVATYKLDPAPAGGVTLMGSPTIVAQFGLTGSNSQVAARLLDVAPGGTEQLVARGLWRPEVGVPSEQQVFQLHPNGWHFAEGHVAKLELLAADADDGALGPYGRRSDGQEPVDVSGLELRLPVLERPGAVAGLIGSPAPRVLPEGSDLASDFVDLGDPRARVVKGRIKVSGKKLVAKINCPTRFDSCNDGEIVVKRDTSKKGKTSGKGKRAFKVAKGGFELAGGATEKSKLKLSARAKRYYRNHRGLRVKATLTTAEAVGEATQKRRARR